MISVSDSTLATKVLDINGLDKITIAGRATDFRLGKEEVATFINLGCVHWSDENKVTFARLGILAGSLAFMNSVPYMFPSGLPSDIESITLNALNFDRKGRSSRSVDFEAGHHQYILVAQQNYNANVSYKQI